MAHGRKDTGVHAAAARAAVAFSTVVGVRLSTSLGASLGATLGASLGVALVVTPSAAFGQITTDGSTDTVLSGSALDTVISGGTRAGDNLFHSFADFNVAAGGSATFTGPSDIANLVNRVTGADPSQIDGLLRSQVGQADVYFINPNGVTFGAAATVDVPAGFAVSTADELVFADGSTLALGDSAASAFVAAAPESFGFLGAEAGDITFDNTRIVFSDSVTIAGGDVSLANDSRLELLADAAAQDPEFRVEAETLTLIDGSVLITSANDAVTGADIVITTDGLLRADGEDAGGLSSGIGAFVDPEDTADGGDLTISAGSLEITNGAQVGNTTSGLGNTGAVDVTVSGDVLIDGTTSDGLLETRFFTASEAGGESGAIALAADDIVVSNGANVFIETVGDGDSGDIIITATTLRLASGADLEARTFGAGDGGAVTLILADGLVVDGFGSIIQTAVGAGGTGRGGNLSIESANTDIVSGGRIATTTSGAGDAGVLTLDTGLLSIMTAGDILTSTFAEGRGADAFINADAITIDGFLSGIFSQVSQDATGAGGALTIAADSLMLTNLAQINGLTEGVGNGGDITVNVSDVMLSSGAQVSAATSASANASSVTFNVDTLSLLSESRIVTFTSSDGRGGDITVDASDAVSVDFLSVVDAGAGEFASGRGGDISISADLLEVIRAAQVNTSSNGTGDAGDISIDVNRLDVLSGGSVQATAFGAGSGGVVTVNAADAVTVDGSVDVDFGDGVIARLVSLIATQAGRDAADAGSVTVVTDALTVSDEGLISTSTLGGAQAGDIVIEARDVTITSQGGIDALAFGAGRGGDIAITAAGTVRVESEGEVEASTVLDATGDAGSIVITADAVEVTSAGEIVSDSRSMGDGGIIAIDANTVLVSDFGEVSGTTSVSGEGGGITITASDSLTVSTGGVIETNSILGGSGDGGTITVTADSLNVIDDGEISADTTGSGDAGPIVLNARVLTLNSSSRISANTGTFETPADDGALPEFGDAGLVTVNVERAFLSDSARITSTTRGGGGATTIALNVGDQLILDGSGASITSEALDGATGSAGGVVIDAPGATIALAGGAQITTASAQPNADGEIAGVEIRAGRLIVDGFREDDDPGATPPTNLAQRTQITSSATGAGGDAGRVTIQANQIQLTNGGLITTNSATGEAGDISLSLPQSGSLSLLSGAITTTAEAGDGSGGAILAASPGAVVLQNALIEALGETAGANVQVDSRFLLEAFEPVSTVAVNGTLNLDAQLGDVTAGADPLEAGFLSAVDELNARCLVQRAGEASTLSITEPGPAARPQPSPLQSLGLYAGVAAPRPQQAARAAAAGVCEELRRHATRAP